MGTITSGIGLASGIDTGNIIEQLIQIERRPIQQLESRIAETASTQVAYAELSTRLNALKGSGTSLRKPSTFEAVTARSGNEQVATVEASVGAPTGRYELRVQSLVQSQQATTGGFSDKEAVVPEGTFTIEVGDNSLLRETPLSEMNLGEGISNGKFRLTDRTGNAAIFDTGDYTTLDELVSAINFNLDVDVTAGVEQGALVLEDRTGGSGTLRVRDLGDGTAAAELGIAESTRASSTSSTIRGAGPADISVSDAEMLAAARDINLSTLNGGDPWPSAGGNELRVRTRDFNRHDINTDGLTTIGDLIDRFNDETNSAAILSLDTDTGNFIITDNTTPLGDELEIQSRNSLGIAELLGIDIKADVSDESVESTSPAFDANQLRGELYAAKAAAAGTPDRPGGILSQELRGGAGISTGTFTITDRSGNSASIDANTPYLDDVLLRVNTSGIGVTARLNDAGNGIVFQDTTGGAGDLIITDDSGTAASDLNIAGTYAAADGDTVDSGNLQRAFIGVDSSLKTYDIGKPIGEGVIEFTDSGGGKAELDLSIGSFDTLGDVINGINGLGIGVSARVNDNGDGLLIEDTAGGTGTLNISDIDGSAAEALRIGGEFEDGVADGSFEVSIEVEAGETLTDVRNKINSLGFGIRAEVINDGSPDAPWRLSMTARNGGTAGAFTIDAGETGLGARTIAGARDAVVLLGAPGQDPLRITSSTNTIEDALPGLSIDLFGTTAGTPVEITVSSDQEKSQTDVETMIAAFNSLRESLDDRTSYNAETGRRGALLGEQTVQRVERDVYRLVDTVYNTGNPSYRILSDIGIRIGEGAKLEFDEDKFRAAWADDDDAVKEMFTASVDGAGVGFGHRLQDVITKLTDPVDGIVTLTSDQLDEQTAAFEQRIANIEETIVTKEQRLRKEFLDMELALSKLQFQQQQISAIPTFNTNASRGSGS